MGNHQGRFGKFINSWFFGAALILAGVLFLFKDRLFLNFSIATLWPLFMLIPVVILSAELVSDFGKKNATIVPIVILSFLMCYFLWLNFTGWENTAHTWPNFVLAPGVGLLLFSLFSKKREPLVPALILIALAAVFYATIINSSALAAAILIASGAVLLVQNFFKTSGGGDEKKE